LERVEDLLRRRVLAPDGDRVAADHLEIGQSNLFHEASRMLIVARL